ncbi:CathepsinC exc and Peptidase C1 domain containing protein [Trichuris trichiura]|uniref:Dipeptidyl peptidase 1 n=1 Tax=Trichuris trichiura TaxID=36087 RepID=A0A077Z0X8_TRITR|nr:CathepsinC exc and Peptidase C1 domain containing protein [Trichuris trichiura]
MDTTAMDKLKRQFINNKDYIDAVNRAQSKWVATAYKEWETESFEDMIRKAGARKASKQEQKFNFQYFCSWPKPPPSSAETKRIAAALPEHFDWRNVSGVNYVSDVRDQHRCGSCYIFASVAVLESRYRILTQNEEKPTFSPQDVLNCSPYAQGCDGGFPFLIAGKHAEDFGMVTESCEPYTAHQFPCRNNRDVTPCERYYATNYQYVGGYYGASNEDLIKLAVYHNGPVAVGIQVYPDFYAYRSGIYHHVKDAMNFNTSPYGWNPFVAVDHAVTVVGYGVERGTKYWIVKNSWGKYWGENGYVKILRGTNECGIESLAFESTPIIPKMDQEVVHILLLLLLFYCSSTGADTPSNCSFDEVAGTWKFFESNRGLSKHTNCSSTNPDQFRHVQVMQLLFPNVAIDSYGNTGVWTLIVNQGFEVNVNNRKYFAFTEWTERSGHHAISICDKTRPGWAHDKYSRDWSCFAGQKIQRSHKLRSKRQYKQPVTEATTAESSFNRVNYQHPFYAEYRYINDLRFIEKINEVQSNWKATAYPQFEHLSRLEIVRKMGGPKSRIYSRPKPATVSERVKSLASELPENFDWRNVSGINYVSPVRSQGQCGSCYAFASAAMLESRYRILTENTYQPVFSPQDIVDCSPYSQGCDGGFPYLIGGKYAEDYGWVLEECSPYKGKKQDEQLCDVDRHCKRFYATDYAYVGGFYGGCNEPLMRLALVENGPIVVGMNVFDDFLHYKGGIYHHTKLKDTMNWPRKWNPYEITNHAVVIVGYGVDDQTDMDYWIVKNSWGTHWGEDGYFRIRRGVDECGIESSAFEATPIPTF